MSDEPKEQSKGRAEKEASHNGQVEGGVFAAVDDVSGQAAEAEREFTAEIKKSASDDEESTENEKGAAEFAEGLHREHSSRMCWLRFFGHPSRVPSG
jgi:hypothetical protein